MTYNLPDGGYDLYLKATEGEPEYTETGYRVVDADGQQYGDPFAEFADAKEHAKIMAAFLTGDTGYPTKMAVEIIEEPTDVRVLDNRYTEVFSYSFKPEMILGEV